MNHRRLRLRMQTLQQAWTRKAPILKSAAVGQAGAAAEGDGEEETQEMDALTEPQDGDDPEPTG